MANVIAVILGTVLGLAIRFGLFALMIWIACVVIKNFM